MSSAASTAGYLFASGILAQRRAEAQAKRAEQKPVAPRPVQVTYRKRRVQ